MSSQAPTPWPPALSEDQLATLTLLASTYALSHGLVYLPPAERQPPAPTSTIHAPLALFPSPFPRRLFQQARDLQRTYNVLYARVASDAEFLDRVMGERGVGSVDEFTGQLWRRWKRLRDSGSVYQPLQLGLFRSDYMVHVPDPNAPPSLKQVEFNTISSSFGALSQRTSELHRYLYASTNYFVDDPNVSIDSFPPNETIKGLAEGLAAAHRAYGVKDARILFVVQDGERNVFDQRWLEYELLERHSIHVIRQTLFQLASTASVHPSSHALHIASPSPSSSPSTEIAVVYYRAGYTPTDYPTPAHYDTRARLEGSRAIQCPSLALQLAGGKKVQEVLTQPGVLERFLLPPSGERGARAARFTQEDLAAVRASWMEMWSLDANSNANTGGDGDDGVQRARAGAATLVLKPQREGGGNNVYKGAIPAFLDALPAGERAAWIAMRLIETPKGRENYLVRAGGAAGAGTGMRGGGGGGAVRAEVVSELGIFGWALFGGGDGAVEEREVGWLVRTKGTESDEGGVAAGFSVLDSVLLVD